MVQVNSKADYDCGIKSLAVYSGKLLREDKVSSRKEKLSPSMVKLNEMSAKVMFGKLKE